MKYTAITSPGHVVLSPSNALIATSRRLNRFRVGPHTKPRQHNGVQTILWFVLTCGLLIALSGCGSGFHGPALGSLQITPNTVDFGAVPVGQAANTGLAIVNESSASVVISSLSFAGATFSADSADTLPINIPAGGSHTLQVQFKPTAAGLATGRLTVSSNLTTDGTAVVSLAGMGMAPSSPQLTVSATNLNFGSVPLSSPTDQSITLTSTGTSPVTVNSASISGTEFTIIGDSFPVTLNPNQSATVQVQFQPTIAGAAVGQLTIGSNSATSASSVVTLSGTGAAISPSDLNPQLSVSAANLSFGSVTVDSATTQAITLTSTGTSPVTVNSASITGTGFSIVGGSFPITLNPSQAATVTVQFKPTAAGSDTGQITITSNSSTASSAVVALSGTGTAALNPQLSVSAANLSFGSVTVDSATTQAITLTSTGTSPVTVNSASITGTGFSIVGGSFPITLNPSQAATVTVQFKPTAAGSDTGQITITSNSSTASSAVVALSGTGTAALNPQLSVSTANLSFGSVTVDSATTQAITLTSTGTSPVTVNSASITGTGFSIVGGSFPVTLNPSQAATVTVQFKPTAAGSDTGQITITSNSSTASSAVVALSGTGTAALNPQLSVSTANLSFGSVTVDSATTQAITLTSTGTSPVTVNSASITGTGFSIVGGSFPVTLNPSQAATVTVQFKPTAAGSDTGQVTITSNSSTASSAVVALSGTGTAALNPQLSVSAANLSFGSVTVDSATTQAITLTSTGTSPVTVNSASITGTGFSIVGGSFPITLNPSQAATVTVQFKPTAAGSDTGQVTITSNSSTASSAVVALSGTGTAALNPQLSVSAANLSFGSVTVDSATTQAITLTSTGTSPVTVNSASITGTGFSIVGGSFPVTLNPSQAATVTVQFKPTAAGSDTGQVTITSNSSTASSAVVALSGTGTAALNPQLSVSAANLSFGSVTVDSATTQAITLTSTGTSPVTVNSASITGTGFSIVGGSFPITLNPSQAATVTVQFKPTAAGSDTGQITITSNSSTASSAVVALSGTGTAALNPQLSVSAANLSFGSVTVDSATTQAITLTSTGTSPVTVNSASITGTGFSIVGGSFPVTLNPSQAATVTVQFKPTAAGSDTGQVTITSNSSTASSAVVALSGTGTAALNPQLSVSAANLSFGSVTVDSATTQAITLTSTGTSPVTVNSASITGTSFSIVGGSFPVTLNPSQAATVTVQFKPTAAGSDTGQVTITSNSSTASSAVVALSGTGTAALNPQLSVSAANLSFGSVTVDSATTQAITLTSTGTSPVTVNSASITGTGFSIVGGSFPVTLNPSQSVTIQIQFLPTVAGAATGQVTITSNSSTGSSAVVALSGTATASNPQLTVSTTSLNFGSADVNSPTTQSVTLNSTGTSPVTVNTASVSGIGFAIVGGNFPVTLNPSQTATITVQFKPTAAGSNTGQIIISSNSTSGSSTIIALNGTGTAVSYSVNLSWDAPTTSTDPVVGYNIYRAVGTGAFQLINSSPDAQTTYVDNAVVSGTTYNYLAKSVDSTGVESTASNEITVTIP